MTLTAPETSVEFSIEDDDEWLLADDNGVFSRARGFITQGITFTEFDRPGWAKYLQYAGSDHQYVTLGDDIWVECCDSLTCYLDLRV